MKLKRLWDKYKIKNNSKIYSSGEVLDRLESEFSNTYTLTTDTKYRVPSIKAFNDILENDVTDEIEYQSEYFDCDKFALLFKSISALNYRVNGIGIAISYKSRHAFNIILVEERGSLEVYKLEPQTDEIWKKKDPEREKYQVNDEVILI